MRDLANINKSITRPNQIGNFGCTEIECSWCHTITFLGLCISKECNENYEAVIMIRRTVAEEKERRK